ATFLRSATENDGYSPVEPRTTTPSAPWALKKASMSLYKSSSNFRFLSQGVAAAIQKRHLSPGAAGFGGGAATDAGNPTALSALTAPRPSRNVLRVVSIFRSPSCQVDLLRCSSWDRRRLQLHPSPRIVPSIIAGIKTRGADSSPLRAR